MEARFVLIIFSYLFIICEGFDNPIISAPDSDAYLNTIQFFRKYGYPAEAHIVETADGYLLQMHRIPHGKNSTHSRKKPPVLLQHGLLGSSFDFAVVGPEQGLAFLLADMGYDVWLGNVRGNVYSRAHVKLTPKDRKFWDFTWHESGIYDLPAQIDFICNYTKQEKIVYMGHSMGTSMFFVLTSTLPEYNKKIEVSMLMAAVGYLTNIKSPLLRTLVPIFPEVRALVELLSNGEFLGGGKLTNILGRIFCEMNVIELKLCLSSIFLVTGSDFREFNQSLVYVLNSHYPNGYSVKGLSHYTQLVKSDKFRQFDYGPRENRRRYGSPTPPDYQVENIKVPMYIYEGKNDYLSTLPDVKPFAKRLKTLKRLDVLEYPKFNHLDFVISSDVKKQLYNSLLEDLTSFLERKSKKLH